MLPVRCAINLIMSHNRQTDARDALCFC